MGDRDLHLTITITRRTLRRGVLLLAALALAVPGAVWAGDSFSDVPNSNIFHDDIDWMAENGVTRGCGGDRFCPSDTVTREQMSAFMRRLDSQDVFTTPAEVDADLAALEDRLDALDANDDLVPLVSFHINDGGQIRSASWRAPVTGAPVGTDTPGGYYTVEVPGIDLQVERQHIVCTASSSDAVEISVSRNFSEELRIYTFVDGTPSDRDVDCVVWPTATFVAD